MAKTSPAVFEARWTKPVPPSPAFASTKKIEKRRRASSRWAGSKATAGSNVSSTMSSWDSGLSMFASSAGRGLACGRACGFGPPAPYPVESYMVPVWPT